MAKTSRIRRLSNEPELELDPGQDPFARDSIQHLVSRFGSPLFLIDAERVRAQYRSLAAALPGVALYYAIKSLPHAAIVAVLRQEGACFDLATNGEVQLVRRLGIAPDRCIHTHPIKRDCDIRTALNFGVTHFVVDNEDELRKFVKLQKPRHAPDPSRIPQRCRLSICRASSAASRRRCRALLALAAELRINVVGLSFHAGSQAANPADACAGDRGLRRAHAQRARVRTRAVPARHRRRVSGRLRQWPGAHAHRGVLRTHSPAPCRPSAAECASSPNRVATFRRRPPWRWPR